ncbi:MAG TPA: 4Fe-4S binding protein [Rhodocyclaceae bacterium]
MSETRCLACSCNGTVPLPETLGDAAVVNVHALCRGDVETFRAAGQKAGPLVVGCTQEKAFFGELAERMGMNADLRFVNLRELAGWSAEGKAAGPKMAALVTLAAQPAAPPVDAVRFASRGSLAIIGPEAAAVDWAISLGDELDVAVFSTSAAVRPPRRREFPLRRGQDAAVSGHLGAFEVAWRDANPIDSERCVGCGACVAACPEAAIGRDLRIDLDRCARHGECIDACGAIAAIDFARLDAPPRRERFDLVLDLSRTPLIRLPHLPDGYFAPGSDALEQAEAARRLLGLVGEFQHPRYLAYREERCAHSRLNKIGCHACVDVCSTGAIASRAGRIEVDAYRCAGCGGCATVCPTGAARFAYPGPADLMSAVQRGLAAYRAAGGKDACLLVHDGRSLPRLLDLHTEGRGLPARVIPLEVHDVAAFGLDLALAALCYGAAQVRVLTDGEKPEAYVAALERQFGYGNEILKALGHGAQRLGVFQEDGMPANAWWTLPAVESSIDPAAFQFPASKREALDFSLTHLVATATVPAEEIALPTGAPFGAVTVSERCTLCLSCVAACPTGALLDGSEEPRLRFVEWNCIQCGLCRDTCPETAITLVSRLSPGPAAHKARTLAEAKPFHCLKCDKPFGTERMVQAMLGRLGGHSMYVDDKALRRLQMCGDCRVIDMMETPGEMSILEGKP